MTNEWIVCLHLHCEKYQLICKIYTWRMIISFGSSTLHTVIGFTVAGGQTVPQQPKVFCHLLSDNLQVRRFLFTHSTTNDLPYSHQWSIFHNSPWSIKWYTQWSTTTRQTAKSVVIFRQKNLLAFVFVLFWLLLWFLHSNHHYDNSENEDSCQDNNGHLDTEHPSKCFRLNITRSL